MRRHFKKIYWRLIDWSCRIFGVRAIKKIDARIRASRHLDFDNPRTLADKICYLELYEPDQLISQCTDKFEVRSFIQAKGYADILIPLHGNVYNSVAEIDFDSLPEQFVLKATHSSGMTFICTDKAQLDIRRAQRQISKWRKPSRSVKLLEPHYWSIPPRIICEEYLADVGTILDYKFHCMNGVPHFIQVCSGRRKNRKFNLYDLNWEPINGIKSQYQNRQEIPCPEKLSEMIAISKELSTEFKYVRVDLYQIGHKIYFGELTFTPAAGILSSMTDEFISDWSSKLQIYAPVSL